MDDTVFDGRDGECAGLEDLSQTARMGPSGKHVSRLRPRSRPPKWNPRGKIISPETLGECISDVPQFLIKITSNRYAVNSLLLRSGLLSWIEIQVNGTVTGQEAVQWCRVLDNVLTVSDAIKMESVTEGQWRKSIMRIVERVLETNGKFIWLTNVFPADSWPKFRSPCSVNQ